MSFKLALFLILSMVSVKAFFHASVTPRRSTTLSMMWDTKKVPVPKSPVPNPVVEETTLPNTVSRINEDGSILNYFGRRAPPGAGLDERFTAVSAEAEAASLSRMDRAFRMHSLKMNLEGDYIGTAAKLQRIHTAATLDGTLPGTLVGNGNAATVAQVAAGGLFQDWDAAAI